MHRKIRGTIMKTERYYVSENVTLTVEVSTGRLDIIVRRYYDNITQTEFWYATRDTKTKKWDLNYCFNGFCYNSAKLTERFSSRADVISYLSELATRIYNEGYEKMIVSELTTFETILFDDKKNVPVSKEPTETSADKEPTETSADKEHEETIKFYHVRDTKTGDVENVFATSEESAKRLVFGRRDTKKSCLVIEPVTVDGMTLETTVCSLDGYTGIKIKCGNRTYYYRTRRENTNWVLYELQDGFDTYGLDDMVLYRTRKEAIASAEKHVQKRVQRIAEFKAMTNRRETVSDTDSISTTPMTKAELDYCIDDLSVLNDNGLVNEMSVTVTGTASTDETENTTIYEVLVDNTVSETRFIVKRYNGNVNRTYIYNQLNLPKTVLDFMLSKDVEIKKGRDTTLYRVLDKTVYKPHEKLYIKNNESVASWIERNMLSGAIAECQIVAIYDSNNNVEYIGKACYAPINMYHVIERFEFVGHELRINERQG